MRFKPLPILVYCLLAYGLAWLAAFPLWLSGGLANPLFLACSVAMMFTPALAAVITLRLCEPGTTLASGLALGMGSSPWRTVGLGLLGSFLMILVCFAAVAIGAALGLIKLDLVGFSGFQAILDAKLKGHALAAALPPIKVLVALQLASIVIATPVNAIFAAGEETGWRGYLLPRLMPLGTIPAVLLSGAIWALWHAPLILLGYNYPGVTPWLALACMTGMCIAFGSIIAWLRLKSGSILPAALAHGAFNAAAGVGLLLNAADSPIDPTQASALGWSGWILPAILGIGLFVLARPRSSGTSV